ncbi:hypothetical protein [Herpetosiphon sp. NSE202]|uniref:hypothetical protein n=1 Tax=Herpetosiphon sp. NSE202 TaxID=3351349 RepID=UPI0036379B55
MNQEILEQTLRTIQAEHPDGDKGLIVMWVSRLIEDAGEERLAERLDEAISHTWPWKVVAVLYEILSWWTSDEGSALLRTTESWLREGTNLRRIQIALAQDTYPFIEAAEMYQVLEMVAQRFPEVADQCAYLINSRKRRD